MKLSEFLNQYQTVSVQKNNYKYRIVDFRDLSNFVDNDGIFLTARELKEKLSSVYKSINEIPTEYMECEIYKIAPEITDNQLYLRITIV